MRELQSHRWPGAPLALASAALFGAVAPASKLLVGSMGPWMLSASLYLGAGIGLGLFAAATGLAGRGESEARLSRSDLPWLAAIVLFGGMLGPALLMAGIARTSASTASLLLNLEGIATMAIAWIVLREHFDRRILAGALAIAAGAFLLALREEGARLDSGAALVALACVAWAIDNNLTRKLVAADPVQVAAIKCGAGGLANLAIAVAAGADRPALSAFAAAAAIGLAGVGASLVFFLRAMRHLGTARAAAYFSLAPFIGAAVSLAVFGDPLTLQLLAAAGLMAFGLWLHLAERHAHEHWHEEFEHEHRHAHDEHHLHDHPQGAPERHSHRHRHTALRHSHAHYPDLHHRHGHR
jgi:drug/metabolite transporter (DMT)-like permease